MTNHKLAFAIWLFFLLFTRLSLHAQQPNDIVGLWISMQRNVMVEIYKDSLTFKGKVVWFDDSDDNTKPMNTRTDINNPVKSLRNRKIIGIDVLKGLTYNTRCNCWQNGRIYDVQTGKTWNASLTLLNKNLVKVRGFWHYEFFGRSMRFRRVK